MINGKRVVIRQLDLGDEEYFHKWRNYAEGNTLNHFIDFMFRFLNLNRIELTTLSDNYNAKKLYERLGFKKIGLIREKSFDSRTGKYIEVLYMDLLRREWDLIGKL